MRFEKPGATPAPLVIVEDDLSGNATRELIAMHFAGMSANSPAGHCHVLDRGALRTPDIRVWSARSGDAVVGVGALKDLAGGSGELKSMRTHPDHLRRGIGAALLEHIVCVARERGLTRLSLETGSGPAFEPALTLYRKRGFRDGEAFADYLPSAFNRFLHLTL